MDLIWFAVALGALFLFIGALSLRRGWIMAGGRLTRQRVTGSEMRLIALPQAIVGALALLVGGAGVLGNRAIGQYSDEMIILLGITYLVTNLGIGGYIALKHRRAAASPGETNAGPY